MKTWKDPDVKELFELDDSLTEEGWSAADAGDVDFIPTERIPGLRALMNETDGPVTTYIRHKAAIYLTYWGYEDGVEYIANEVAKSSEDRGGIFVHRLHGYDITLELFARALSGYLALKSDAGEWESAAKLVRSTAKTIIKTACVDSFEIESFFHREVGDHYAGRRLIDDPAIFQRYLVAMLDQKDNRRQGYKPHDAVKFFEKYDREFLQTELDRRGLKASDI